MLESPKLRKALLPTVRAEFGMAYNYKHRPVERFSFPICSFVGDLDPWVTEQDSAGWGDLTRGGFTNHLRKGSHFLLVDDREFILEHNQQRVRQAGDLTAKGEIAGGELYALSGKRPYLF